MFGLDPTQSISRARPPRGPSGPQAADARQEANYMFRRFTKKRSLALSGLLLLLLASGAVAYFTASGSGTGTATVGTSSALTIHGSSGSTLYPGTTSTISFTVDNPSSGRQQLGTIHLASVKACTGAGSSWNGSSCSAG